ncbi:MAG: histidine kinase [Sporichthyaceae bacterium]|nr:histidine kinase [Sporichthyaceae bacterium]
MTPTARPAYPGSWLAAKLPPRLRRPALLVRAGLVLVCTALAPPMGEPEALLWLCGLVGIALAGAQVSNRTLVTGFLGLEAITWGYGVVATGGEMSPLLPYLIAPLFAAGLAVSVPGVFATAGAASVGLTAASAIMNYGVTTEFSVSVGQFLIIATLVGLIAAWLRSLRLRTRPDAPYVEAHRLLGQLHSVALRLPGTLDLVSIAGTLLDRVAPSAEAAGFAESAVLIDAGGERLVPLAHRGSERLVWDTSVHVPGPLAEAWVRQELGVHQGRMPGVSATTGPGTSMIAPLCAGSRTLGVLVLESKEPRDLPAAVRRRVIASAEEGALQLATALLFDNVREVATTEERRRLSREIHDGVAQELASLGYLVDGLVMTARELGDQRYAEGMQALRERITKLMAELRISIYDLRSEVDPYGGLGAALSEYVRTIGTTSDLTVHLSLDEAPNRLPAQAEAELLRIAQQAIANARRHAQADNLWVTCRVAPPHAQIMVEDDGRGLIPTQGDGFGLSIIRERAERLGARLVIEPRTPTGTRVDVRVGPAGDPKSQSPYRAEPDGAHDGQHDAPDQHHDGHHDAHDTHREAHDDRGPNVDHSALG